jgi:uncharacterized protein YegJ (DUF2314 family)
MRFRLSFAAALWIAAASSGSAATADAAQKSPFAPVGPIQVSYLLHFAPLPHGDVVKQGQELVRSRFPSLKVLRNSDESAAGPAVFMAMLDLNPAEGLAPPSMEILKYFGRGVSREQAEAMQKSKVAAVVTFTYGPADAIDTARLANEVMSELATRTAGLIWDDETRELFAPAALAEKRMPPPDHGFPDVRSHIVIHAYKNGEYIRAITLGMRKFGLPDIVINEFSWSLNDQMGNTINLFAQSLLEGATPPMGRYDFDVSKLKHEAVRAVYEKHLLDNSHTVAQLTLANAKPDEGDPDNRLLELRFDRYTGKTVHEQHENFAGSFYGSVDTVAYVKHNQAIEAASARARLKLPALRKEFNAGLQPGETLLLKAPFETSGGAREWMWVEVSSWKGNAIVGLLANEPEDVPGLRAGATVSVSEKDIFDYILNKADGSMEGNETGKLIEKFQTRQ